MNHEEQGGASASEREEESLKHVSFSRYLVVWLVLSLLTLGTYATSLLPQGSLAMGISLSIAVVKASLVALFFMHLWEERGAIPLTMTLSGVLLLVLLGFTVTDAAVRAAQPVSRAKSPGVAWDPRGR